MGRSKPSLTALIALLIMTALLFTILRMILPWAQSAFLQSLDLAVWADYTGPYNLTAAVMAAGTFITFLLRR